MVELYAATEGYRAEGLRLRAELRLRRRSAHDDVAEALERLDRLEATIRELETVEPERADALHAARDERSAAFASVIEEAVAIAKRIHGRLAAMRAPGSMAGEKAGHIAAAGAWLAAYQEDRRRLARPEARAVAASGGGRRARAAALGRACAGRHGRALVSLRA